MTEIDWVAVDCVVGGGTLNLTPAERKAVVRQVAHKLVAAGVDARFVPPGRFTAQTLANRMGCGTGDAVWQMLRRMPAATKHRCPRCGCDAWLLADGAVEEHASGFLRRCPMSERDA